MLRLACLAAIALSGCVSTPPPVLVPALTPVVKVQNFTAKPPISKHGRPYGWHRSSRVSDHPRYAIPQHLLAAPLPPLVDLRPGCPPPYDQGDLGSCTGNALAGLHEFLQIKEGKVAFVPSRLMIYWGERAAEDTIDQDSGANGDDGVTFLTRYGVCPEPTWPYDVKKFTVKPDPTAWSQAAQHRISGAATIGGTLIELKTWLATEKVPIAFGFTVYPGMESEEVAKTGILPMPGPDEDPIGGHEVLLVGYDESKQVFIVRNSWGPDWGDHGYFYMPYHYVANSQLASDFRSARKAA